MGCYRLGVLMKKKVKYVVGLPLCLISWGKEVLCLRKIVAVWSVLILKLLKEICWNTEYLKFALFGRVKTSQSIFTWLLKLWKGNRKTLPLFYIEELFSKSALTDCFVNIRMVVLMPVCGYRQLICSWQSQYDAGEGAHTGNAFIHSLYLSIFPICLFWSYSKL